MVGKKVELCCLMAETGREERGGIPKGDMSYSHLLFMILLEVHHANIQEQNTSAT
jgi:hypothetical protein